MKMKAPVKNALMIAAIFIAGVVTGSVNSIGVGNTPIPGEKGYRRAHRPSNRPSVAPRTQAA
jgi:hypothetical protein